jgi:hypothetical protein
MNLQLYVATNTNGKGLKPQGRKGASVGRSSVGRSSVGRSNVGHCTAFQPTYNRTEFQLLYTIRSRSLDLLALSPQSFLPGRHFQGVSMA